MKRFPVLVLLILAIGALTTTAFAQENDPQIRLHSRTFSPDIRTSRSVTAAKNTSWIGLVQLNGAISAAERVQLAQQGIELLQYVPQNTWVARISPTQDGGQARSSLNLIRWMGELQPSDKISSDLLVSAETPNPLTVRVVTWDGAATELEQFGVVSADKFAIGHLLTLDPAQLQAVAALNNTQWIEPNVKVEQLSNELVTFTNADVAQAAPFSLSGNGINVGIFDFDPMAEHSDLAGRIFVSPDFTNPPQNHATIMAGTVGAAGDNYPGIAPNVNMTAYRFWVKDPLTTGEVDIAVQAWGSPNCTRMGTYNSTAANYDAIVETPLVFAAGNSQSQCNDRGGYQTLLSGPQSAKNIITVGSTNYDGDLSSFSSQGPLLDGRIGPTLVAPGESITSTCLNDSYCGGSGTSFSAPGVAGAMALMLEHFRVNNAGAPDPMPSSYRAALVNSATDDEAKPGPDFSYGFGMLNVAGAVEQIELIKESSLVQGDKQQFQTIAMPGQTELRITLAWDDVPASAYAETTLVNDLDLTLIDPQGNIHYPFVLDADNPSHLAQRGIDSINVTEQIIIENPIPGQYNIVVDGEKINVGTQSFSVAGITQVAPTAVLLSQISTLNTGANATLLATYLGMLLMALATVWLMRDQNI